MEIYIAETNDIKNIPEELLNSFQKREFKNEKNRKVHSFAYLMLDRILKDVYKIDDRSLGFKEGKPVLLNSSKCFSISHSGEYLAIAVSDSNCGVDIEEIKKRDYVGISKRMKFDCDSLEEFYKRWTEYESHYKLHNEAGKTYQIKLENYILTACSDNLSEDFQVYIQNGEGFSNQII